MDSGRRSSFVNRVGVAAITVAAAFAAAASASASGPASAATPLAEVWRAAERNDRDHAVARAVHQVAQSKSDQAAALWRPTVALAATAGVGSQETQTRGAQFSAPGFGSSTGVGFNTSVRGGTLGRLTITAVQPLYNRQRRVQQEQASLAVQAAEFEWLAARQRLMLRTAERYFELALAEESLRVLRLQLEVVQRAYIEARDRFELGSVPVTDTHEARARLASIRAQVLSLENEVGIKRQELADSTGLPAQSLQAVLPAVTRTPPPVRPLDAWLVDAETGNLDLRRLAIAADQARQDVSLHSLRAATSVDLVAQAGHDRLSGSGDYGSAANSSSSRLIGVQVSIPLYTGGYRSAREQEALLLVAKAQAHIEQSKQQVAQQVRANWARLDVGALRVLALTEGLHASEARRDATRTGLQVGHRTTQDLLNAESDLAAARLTLIQSQVGLILDRMRLAVQAGLLDEAVLHGVVAETR